MDPSIVVGGLVTAALFFDRAMLWAEKRGWVYWRRNKASRSAWASAMLELQAILEPDKEHVVEERARQRGDIPVVVVGGRAWTPVDCWRESEHPMNHC